MAERAGRGVARLSTKQNNKETSRDLHHWSISEPTAEMDCLYYPNKHRITSQVWITTNLFKSPSLYYFNFPTVG